MRDLASSTSRATKSLGDQTKHWGVRVDDDLWELTMRPEKTIHIARRTWSPEVALTFHTSEIVGETVLTTAQIDGKGQCYLSLSVSSAWCKDVLRLDSQLNDEQSRKVPPGLEQLPDVHNQSPRSHRLQLCRPSEDQRTT